MTQEYLELKSALSAARIASRAFSRTFHFSIPWVKKNSKTYLNKSGVAGLEFKTINNKLNKDLVSKRLFVHQKLWRKACDIDNVPVDFVKER
jgi:hypothetical protein